jgi:hypothetical protein
MMNDETYKRAVVELFSSGLAREEQWEEMATVLKLVSDDLILRDMVTEIDAAVRTNARNRILPGDDELRSARQSA